MLPWKGFLRYGVFTVDGFCHTHGQKRAANILAGPKQQGLRRKRLNGNIQNRQDAANVMQLNRLGQKRARAQLAGPGGELG